MADDALLRLIALAIQSAKIKDPNAGDGTKWPEHYLNNEECLHFAKAVVRELSAAGYRISKDA